MQYNQLITDIQADIYSNGAELITGDILQNVLVAMVGALSSAGACYKGTITPASAAPADLDQATVYLALTAGTYTNFVDSNNDPIVTTGPALITYDGGPSLVFSKTDLPSGSPDAVLYTPQTLTDPQKMQARENIEAAHAVRITSADLSTKPYLYIAIPYDSQELNLRIDVVAHNSSGDKIGYTGSILLALNDEGGGVWTGKQAYYYGDDLALLFSSIAIDVFGDYFLVLACESGNDDITLTIYPTTDTEIAATWYAARPGTEEDTITPTVIGAGGGVTPVTSWQNPPTDTDVPSEKLVYDSLGKRGVVSQTLTWNSSDNSSSVSDVIYGLIPQNFIDLVTKAGATFDTGTGYFSLNGITNIAYDEMQEIYDHRIGYGTNSVLAIFGSEYTARTNFPVCYGFGVSYPNHIPSTYYGKYLAFQNASITKFAFSDKEIYVRADSNNNFTTTSSSVLAERQSRIEEVIGVINVENLTGTNNFFYPVPASGAWFPWLTTVSLKGLKASITLAGMPKLSMSSLAYMINNASTATITITLHADVYTAAQSDAGVQAALSSKTNVSLASA